jgi:hypothetical protein
LLKVPLVRHLISLAAIAALAATSACSGHVENRHADDSLAGSSGGGGAGGSPNDGGSAGGASPGGRGGRSTGGVSGGASTGGASQVEQTVSEPSQIAGTSFNVTLESCSTIASFDFGCKGWVAHVRATRNGGLEVVSSAGALASAPLVRDAPAWKLDATLRLGESYAHA